MSVNIVLFEISHQFVNIDTVGPHFVVFVVLSLDHFQSELDFALTIDGRDVEVESAGCDE